MRVRRHRRYAAGVSLLGVAGLAALTAMTPDRPRAQAAPPAGPPPKVFAFISNHGGSELQRLKSVGGRIDVVAPNWYALRSNGHVRPPWRPGPLIAAARRAGAEVWPVVNAHTHRSRAWERPQVQQRIVQSVTKAGRALGTTGVTLDMEGLAPEQRGAFTALVQAVAASVHATGRKLAVYVPRPGPGSAAAYDWAAIAASADLLLASGYNEHWAGGPPGPITTAAGFSTMLGQALAQAGSGKAVPLVGAFGYRWRPGHYGRMVSSAGAQRLRHRSGTAAVRADGSETFRVGRDTVYYETTAGLRARATAARAAGAQWLGLFSLGREPKAFWHGLATAREHSTLQ